VKLLCQCNQTVLGPAELEINAILSLSKGQAAMPTRFTRNADGKYSTSIVLATQVLNAKVKALHSGLADVSSSAVESNGYAADIIEAVLRTKDIYTDSPQDLGIGLSFQTRESTTFSTNPSRATIRVTTDPVTKTHDTVCQTDPKTGICKINIPTSDVNFANGAPLKILYGFVGGQQQELGTVAVHKQLAPPVDTTVNTLSTTIPFSSLVHGNTFDVVVKSQFKWYLKTIEAKIYVGDNLRILDASTGNTQAFSVATVKVRDGNKEAIVLIAGRKDGKPQDEQAEPTDETLFTIQVKVFGKPKAGQNSTISIAGVRDISNLQDQSLKPSLAGAVIASRDGYVKTRETTQGRTSASVHFDDNNRIVGMFAYVDSGQTEILNTATISSEPLIANIKAVGVQYGGLTKAVSATCSVDASSVLSVKDCAATLDGTEEKGAQKTLVTVKAGEFERDVPFRVHRLVRESVKIQTTSILKPIAGWYQEEGDRGCEEHMLRYLPANLIVSASFTDKDDDEDPVFTDLDVTVLAKVTSSDETKVELNKSTFGAVSVVGKSPGEADVVAKAANGSVLVAKTVTVASQEEPNQLILVGLEAKRWQTWARLSSMDLLRMIKPHG
jgi:hypothetical protein